MTDASPVQVARVETAGDAPLLTRSLLKQRWGDHFRTVRQAKGLSQERLAARAGVAISALANWEQGRNLPKEDSLQAMKELLPQLKTPEEIEAQVVAEMAKAAQASAGELSSERLLEHTSKRLMQLETEVERLQRENESLRAELAMPRTPQPSEATNEPSQGASEGPSVGPSEGPSEGNASDEKAPCEVSAYDAVEPSQGDQDAARTPPPIAVSLAGSKRASLWELFGLRRLRSIANLLTTLTAFIMLSLMFSMAPSGGGGGFCSSEEGSSKPACGEREYWDEETQKCRRKETPPLRDCRVTDGEKPCCESGDEKCGPPTQ